jgi:1,4-dihydroxy-2-naphthoate octaprenyltransferase
MWSGRVVAIIKLGRPFVIVAGLLAFALGAAMAFHRLGALDAGRLGIGLLIMVMAILMAHYANEYADVDTDRISGRTWFSGGSGVLPSGMLPPSWALYASIVCLSVTVILTGATVLSGYFSVTLGLMVAVGVVGGWLYSMPPGRLERSGLGEVDNALLGGFLMTLMGYVPQTGDITPEALLACVPIFLVVLVNLLGTHWSDRAADAAAGKRTLVVRLGDRTKPAFLLTTVLTYGSIILLAGSVFPVAVEVLALLTIPFAVWAVAAFWKTGHPRWGSILMGLLMIMMAAGWVLA